MNLDIVEIALDYMTDGFAFEKMASEVMREEGYHDIKPLGGVGDFGQDAFQDRFYHREGRIHIVFQYTLEDYIAGKLRDTAKKLEKHQVEFSELVIVTSAKLSPDRQRKLKKVAREEFDLTLQIYERKTLANRLSDFSNGIFCRHFPDVERQIEAARSNQPAFQESGGKFKTAMLKVSIALVFGKQADLVRKSLFDHLILASLVGADTSNMTLSQISTCVAEGLGCEPFPQSQIAASLRRLEAQELVSLQNGRYSLTDKSVSVIEGATIEANNLSTSSISDVVEEVCRVSGLRISREERNRLQRNARDVLAEMFRLIGIELARQFLEEEMPSPLYLESSDRLLALARRQVDERLGKLLIAALADVIQTPSAEQSQMLANWARAYLGVAVMNLDPALREFQETRLRQKIFILDTDFVLRCIVHEIPDSPALLALVQRLADLGCRLIIPEAVVSECATHAMLSPRTHNYFDRNLYGLTSAFVERKVNNVFVQGFYYGQRERSFPPAWSFTEYLQNYYDPADSFRFLRDVIATRLPSAVEIIDPTTLLPTELPSDLVEQVGTELLKLLERSPKSEYRSKEENQRLAYTDAKLFVTALQANALTVTHSDTRCILGGTCYVVTGSSRYLRSAKALGIRDVVSTRPQKLLGLVEIATGPVVDDVAFVRLFENPLLIHAVEQIWSDVRLLLDNGIALTGKTLVRLQWDLDRVLHNRITAVKHADEQAEAAGEDAAVDAGDREYVELFQEATALGYTPHPTLESLHKALIQARGQAELEKAAREQLQEQFDLLAVEIERFGKKKQRYLKKIARRQKAGSG